MSHERRGEMNLVSLGESWSYGMLRWVKRGINGKEG